MILLTAQTVSWSHGKIDTKSITSQSMFSSFLANWATSWSTCTCVPHPMSVISLPFRKISAFPSSDSNDWSGTSSTAARYKVFGSNMMHGSYKMPNCVQKPCNNSTKNKNYLIFNASQKKSFGFVWTAWNNNT